MHAPPGIFEESGWNIAYEAFSVYSSGCVPLLPPRLPRPLQAEEYGAVVHAIDLSVNMVSIALERAVLRPKETQVRPCVCMCMCTCVT